MNLRRTRINLLCACVMVLLPLSAAGPAWADEPALAIRSHCERVEISGRLATTTVEQVYVNYISREQEATLRFRLPPDAAVHGLALWVRGMRCPGEIHPRISAEEIYQRIISRRRDPALLTRVAPGLWSLRVFPVPANGTAKVEFRFTQLLPLVEGYLAYTGLAAESWLGVKAQDFDFVATIRAPGGITAMRCPTHNLGLQRGVGGEWIAGVRKEQADLTQPVKLAYKPRAAAPEAACWAAKEGGVFAAILPPSASLTRKRPRQIVFVLDASRSMRGEPMTLARLALMKMVQRLKQQDRFGLVVVGSDAALWKKELLPASDQNKGQAVDYVSGLQCGGGTDLQAGLKAAVTFLKGLDGVLDVLLISDLDDRVGTVPAAEGATTRPAGDANAAWPAAPPPNCRLSSVTIDPGVANSQSIFGLPDQGRMDHVVATTGGVGLSIYKAADVAGAVDEVILLSATPVIADIRYDVKADEAVGLSQVGCSELAGERAIVVAGRYRAAGTVRLTLRAKVDGKEAAQPAELTLPNPKAQAAWANAGLTRVWAYLRAVRMWQETRSRQPDMKSLKAIVNLSRAHRVVTPATAMLVLESDLDYLRRGIPRKVSMLPAGQTPSEAARALAQAAAGPPFTPEMAQKLAVMNQQARELERLGSYQLAAQVFARIADEFPGQFEARRREALIRELVALRELARLTQARRAEKEAYWQQVPWYAAASQAGPTACAPFGETFVPDPRVKVKSPPALMDPKTAKALRTKLADAKFDGIEFKAVVDWLRATTGLNIEVNWGAMEIAGIQPTAAVRAVNLQNVPAERALRAVLDTVGGATPLGFTVDEGVLLISTKEDLSGPRHRRTLIYDVRDLLPAVGRAIDAAAFREFGRGSIFGNEAGNWGTSSGSIFSDGGSPSRMGKGGGTPIETIRPGEDLQVRATGQTLIYDVRDLVVVPPSLSAAMLVRDASGLEAPARLIDIITYTIDPMSWRGDPGGDIGSIQPFGGVLVVTQTWENHRALARFLEALRGHKPFTFRTEVAVEPQPEGVFTAEGHLSEWVLELLRLAKEGKLSRFSSVQVRKVGGRVFARIAGLWLDTSLTGENRVLPVLYGSEAAVALAAASQDLRVCFQKLADVVVAVDDAWAVQLGEVGLTQADDQSIRKLLDALKKARPGP